MVNFLSRIFSAIRWLQLAALLLWIGSAQIEIAQGKPRPNILLIYADDLGYGDVGCYNADSKIPTPNIDRLATEGVRFTDAHSSAAVCTLSRYSILTGEYHWRHVRQNADFPRPSAIDEATVTLPELLRDAGYRTACIGKWHLGWNWNQVQKSGGRISYGMKDALYKPSDFDWSQPIPGGPTDHGFDYYFGDDIPNRPPYAWFENDRLLVAPTNLLADHTTQPAEGNWETELGPSAPDWDFSQVMPRITERASDWIAEQQDAKQPFFLYFSMTAPHAPILPDSASHGKSSAGGYGDYVYQSDQAAGRLLQALAESGLAENTIVIFTSDNGPAAPYAFDRVRHFDHRSSGPFRGVKGDLWEGGHRVPLIVSWPDRIAQNRVSSGLVSQIDLTATLAKLLNITLPDRAARDSIDVSALLFDEPPRSPREKLVYNTLPGRYALRQGDWVYVDGSTGSARPAPDWYDKLSGFPPTQARAILNHLESDVGQRVNLIDTDRKLADQMREQLHQLIESADPAPAVAR